MARCLGLILLRAYQVLPNSSIVANGDCCALPRLLTDPPPATASVSPSPTSPLPPPASCLRSTSTVSGSLCMMPNLIKRLGRRSQFLPP